MGDEFAGEGRTVASVAAGVKMRASTHGGAQHAIVYEPGNGTRYRLALASLHGLGEDFTGASIGKAVLVTWLNRAAGGVAVVIDSGWGALTRSSIGEAFGVSPRGPDAAVLCELLGHLLDMPAQVCEPPAPAGRFYGVRRGRA